MVPLEWVTLEAAFAAVGSSEAAARDLEQTVEGA